MFALCHAEYLVFMGQACLPPYMQAKSGTLRAMSRSGTSPASAAKITTVGFTGGFEGYKEAVEYVYAIFDIEVDPSALNFEGTSPPKYSSAFSKSPDSTDEHVAELCETSCKHSDSLFTALYSFMTLWFVQMGNINGFHIFPLRCRAQDGDLVSRQVLWRQAW